MGLRYRIARAALFIIPAIFAITTSMALVGLSFVFAATLFTASFLTLIFLYLHFDEYINPKIIMEMLTDAFVGIVLITFPSPSESFSVRYFLIMFAVWIFANGIFLITSGIMDRRNKPWFWLLVVVGLTYITMGFVIMNYNPQMMESAKWVVSFTLIAYSGIALFLLLKRKNDYFPFRKSEEEE